MRRFLKTLFLFAFAFGVAAMTKYYGMAKWIENSTWVTLPMVIVGGVGIIMFWGEEE